MVHEEKKSISLFINWRDPVKIKLGMKLIIPGTMPTIKDANTGTKANGSTIKFSKKESRFKLE